MSGVPERGCDYCRSDSNLLYGHVEQVASSDDRGTVLLRCPQCGWLYEDDQRSEPAPVSAEVAHERFAYSFGE